MSHYKQIITNNHYLVSLKLILGSYEKQALHLVKATNEKEAGKQALSNECHDKPDFEEYPNFDGCLDCGEMAYIVTNCKLLTIKQVVLYKDITNFYIL